MLGRMNRLTYLRQDVGDILWLTVQDIRKAAYRFNKENDDGTLQLQSDYGDGDSIKMRGINVDSSRRKDRDAESLRINDRDVDNIRNTDSAIRTDIVTGLTMKNADCAWLRGILREGGLVQGSSQVL
jgi:hypothetical protein